ncbi:hypothetical protein [Mycolicibacterium wolinskyi]|uniref:hypothetical protein n=1 Tax=Mycolicibacterium wolinskyi TaxID=59750 RepID=UPI000AFAD27F|nr:hypothetical protein [Mycolicibacterium wolinskyi]
MARASERACAVLAVLAALFVCAVVSASAARATGPCDDGPLDGISVSPGPPTPARARKDANGSDYFATFAGGDRGARAGGKPARATRARPIVRATRIEIRTPAAKPVAAAPVTPPSPPAVTVRAKPVAVAERQAGPVEHEVPIASVQPVRIYGPLRFLERNLSALPGAVPRAVTPDLRTAVPGVIALVLLTAVAGFVGYRRAQPAVAGYAPAIRRFLR